MVDSKILHRLLFVWSAVLLIVIWQIPVSETVWFSANREIKEQRRHYTAEITAKELDDFIRYWPEYTNFYSPQHINASYKTELPSHYLDWKTRIWFVYHHLDINRFFYVRQRASSLLQILETRKRAEALINELSARNEKVAIEMVDLQKKILRAEKIDEVEFLIISSREEKLRELFRQYP